MKNFFQFIFAALMKEPRRRCRGYRITWRKVMCVVVIVATVGAVLQTCVLSYPLNNWFLEPPATVSSYKIPNSTFHDPPATVSSYEIPNSTFHDPPTTVSSYEIPNSTFHDPPPTVSSYEIPNSTFHVKGTLPLETLEYFPLVLSNNSSNATIEVIPSVPAVEVRSEVSRKGRRERSNQMKPNPRVVPQPPPRLVVPHQRHVTLPPDEALVYAKKELEHAPIVTDNPDLYSPLFRNVSTFKRSYELMEGILKVYIYKDGARPIFHQPHLRGIYASEGWFMKLMEENRQFVTRDPKWAHLFYLPYSARKLELALYVPDSHNIKPLSIFLRDYVNTIAAKYPFWNRTRGADHFLVACHDWGPYTVTEHAELLRNTIKALCNADLSEGIFVHGRDVSLPETTIRRPRRPLRGIGGKRVSQRPILAFFAGNMHGRVRPTLIKYWSGKDEDMRIYGPLPNRVSRVMSYALHMKSSKFCICPMGYEVNSPRIVEAIYNECVPVIIADNFVLPFSEVLDWTSFSVVVAEKDIPNLKDILTAIPMRRYLWMQTNVKMLQKHFLWNPRPIKYDLFHMVLHSIWFNRLNQIPPQQQ